MGYRSEVKIVAGKKAADEIRKILAEHDSQLAEIGTNDKGETLFAADWAKWYEDDEDEFPDVAAIMAVVDKYAYGLAGEDNGMEYCRAGEDDGDTEYKYNGRGYGYLSIGIKVDKEDGFRLNQSTGGNHEPGNPVLGEAAV
jgi:hypothetical protein